MADVFWIDSDGMSAENSVSHKLKRLIAGSGMSEFLEEGMQVAMKISASEDGYEYGLRPIFIRTVAEEVQKAVIKPAIICDGVKLIDYRGTLPRRPRMPRVIQLRPSAGTSSLTAVSAAMRAIPIRSRQPVRCSAE
jgi:hypothetical protein